LPRIVNLASAMIVIAAFRLGREVLIPIALSILFSFLLAPLVSRLERRVARIPAVLSVVAAVMIAIAGLGWFVMGQVGELAETLPEYRHSLNQKVQDLREVFGSKFGRAATMVEELGELEESSDAPAPEVVQVELAEEPWTASRWIQNALWRAVGALVFAGALSLFVTFMLLQKEGLRDRFIWLVGDHRLSVTTQMLEEASRKVSRYMFAQLLVNSVQGVMVGVGLALIGVPDSLLWGMLSALLRFLPYVGPWIAALCPILVSFAVFEGWTHPLLTVALFLTLELFTNNVLEPWVYAAKTGLTSLAILVAALFWTWLWGGFGLFLSTPLTVCLVVMGKYVPQLRFFTVMFGDRPVLSDSARLYQRLLAGDHDGAWNVLAPELEAKPLIEVYDQTLMQTVRLAAADCRQGEIDEERREALERGLLTLVEEAAAFRPAAPGAGGEPVPPAAREPAEGLALLCIPTSDAFDQVASVMLRETLRREGIECEVVSEVHFAGEILDIIARRAPAAVCVSHVPPPALAPIRYLCKRIVEKYPELPIVVGAWTLELDEKKVDLRLPGSARPLLASSLAQARAHAQELLHQAQLRLSSSGSGEPSGVRLPAGPQLGPATSGA
jgi:predicted PurR-regulated permease PerM